MKEREEKHVVFTGDFVTGVGGTKKIQSSSLMLDKIRGEKK